MPTVSLPTPSRGLRRHLSRATSAPAHRAGDVLEIEAALVRASVGALQARRDRCRHCHRTPLVGEVVYVYVNGQDGEDVVCELCRPLRVATPDRSVVVRSPEQAGSVRALAARP
jgi:hypothetical protein